MDRRVVFRVAILASNAIVLTACGAESGASTSTLPTQGSIPPAVTGGAPLSATRAAGGSPTATSTAAPVSWGRTVLVRGWESCMAANVVQSSPDVDGMTRIRDATITCTMDMNDARVSGIKTGPMQIDGWGSETNGAIVEWGVPRRIDNTGGSWVGSFVGSYASGAGDMIQAWFTGTGAYAGLSFMEWIDAPEGTAASGYAVVGVIFPGPLPPPYGTR